LTGEMIEALSQHTILKDAVVVDQYMLDMNALLSGYQYADEHGINEALFKIRVLKNFFGKSNAELYHCFLGVVLHDEIKQILRNHPQNIMIGGQKQLRDALTVLLRHYSDAKIEVVSDNRIEHASALGAVKIYEYTKQ